MRTIVILSALYSLLAAGCSTTPDDPDDTDNGDTDIDPETSICGVPNHKLGFLKLDEANAATEIEAFCAAGYNGITGNLLVQGARSVEGLDCLCHIDGSLQVSASQLTSLDGLGGLQIVEGSLQITRNEQLEGLDALSQLTEFAGEITIENNAALTSLAGLEGLGNVRRVSIEANPMLVDGSGLSGLTHTLDFLVIDSPIERLDLPLLTEVDGDWTLAGTALHTLSVPSLTSISGSLKFWENTGDLGAGGSQNPIALGGHLIVRDNIGLVTMNHFPCVASMPYNASFLDNPALEDFDGLSCLQSVGGRLEIIGNHKLLSLQGLGAASDIIGLVVQGNDALQSLDGLASLTALDSLEVVENPSLTDGNGLEGLTSIQGDLIWTANGNPDMGSLAALTSVGGDITIASCAELEQVDGMAGIESFRGTLTLTDNPSLTQIDGFAGLSRVRSVYIDGNASLRSLDGLAQVESARGSITVSDNVALESLAGLSGITSLYYGSVTLLDLPKITAVSMPLTSLRSLTIERCETLTDLSSLQGLTRVRGSLTLSDNAALFDVAALHAVREVDDDLTITDNPALSTASAEALYDAIGADNVGGEVLISGNGG